MTSVRAADPPAAPVAQAEAKATDGDEKKVDPETALVDMFKKESNLTNTLGMVMVWVKEGYRVGKFEVTQSAYQELTDSNPSKFKSPSQPVENVTWTEAVQFCQQLTEKEQKAGKLPKTFSYSLPTEKQWEYYVDHAKLEDAITSYLGDRRHPENVGLLPANELGLHDTRGNVFEWCSNIVARGGSWMSYGDYIWVWFRFVGDSQQRYDDIGFRIILQEEGAK
jgi:formylglycine-generating enzyme required for sulfatase activity